MSRSQGRSLFALKADGMVLQELPNVFEHRVRAYQPGIVGAVTFDATF
jgi:hypothetical protein